jgi:hypothetical protein
VNALRLVLCGRNLPGDETLTDGSRRSAGRRCLSQEALAYSVGVAKPTSGAPEREGRGRLSALQIVLAVLRPGAYLSPTNDATAFLTHVGNASAGQHLLSP